MNIEASPATSAPESSVNSQIFFSESSRTTSSGTSTGVSLDLSYVFSGLLGLGLLAWAHIALGQCIQSADVTVGLPWGWDCDSSTSHEIRCLFSPREWGYLLVLTLADESVETWSDDDQTAFLSALASFYGDSTLHFSVVSVDDGDGCLQLVVQVSGFPDETHALDSYTMLSGESELSIGQNFGSVPVAFHSPDNG